MRILITKKGNAIFQEIGDNPSLNNGSNNNLYKRHYSNEHYQRVKNIVINNKFPKIKNQNSNNNSKIENSSALINQNSNNLNNPFDISENNIKPIQNPKMIKLHKSKIIVSKQFSDKYEKDLKNNSNLIINSNINNYMPCI